MKQLSLIIFTIFIFLQASIDTNAQIKYDTAYIDLIPFKNSYALFQLDDNRRRGLPASGINLYSDEDSVFSLIAGQVQQVVLIDSVYSVVIKSENEITIIYYNLNLSAVTKGSSVSKGDFVGKASYYKSSKDYYLSIVINKGRKTLSRKDHINMICLLARCRKRYSE
jgi:Peptidase family M23.